MRFVQGGLCRGRFCEELPARHLTLLSLPGTACSPALSDQPMAWGAPQAVPAHWLLCSVPARVSDPPLGDAGRTSTAAGARG